MGGFGTWDLAAYSPERFSAIVIICGGGSTLDAKLLINLPVWVFHRAEDKVVPVSFSESMVPAIRRAVEDRRSLSTHLLVTIAGLKRKKSRTLFVVVKKATQKKRKQIRLVCKQLQGQQ